MRNKKISILLITLFSISAIMSGCGEREKKENEILDNTVEGVINYETSALGIPSNSKDFESRLTSGTYYVVHDGVYYPVYKYGANYDDSPTNYTQPSRQVYFTTENEINIPTLFEGDTLVYYSTDYLLDYVNWERYYDLGYTIGLIDLKTMESGRVFLDLSDDDNVCIIPDSELFAMYDLGAENVLIDKLGGVQIDKSFITDGIISATKKSKTYDLEVYTGTYYKHYSATANTHVFKAYELFASIEYKTMQQFFYEIEIPEYFINGYYMVDGCGMLRLIRGDSYNEETDYNEQLLFPKVDEEAWDYDPNKYIAPKLYSTYEPLNHFTTNQEGKLGYIPEKTKEEIVTEEIKEAVLAEAVIKEIDLFFPENSECTVQIKSPAGETTGDISIRIGKSIKLVNYDRLSDIYEAQFTGHGEKGTLKISGLTSDYDIILTNCEQYTNQLEITNEQPSEEISSENNSPVNSEEAETEESDSEESDSEESDSEEFDSKNDSENDSEKPSRRR